MKVSAHTVTGYCDKILKGELEPPRLDRQYLATPKEIQFCQNCVVSNQRPRTRFNEQGICSACQWAYEKDHVVDWNKREKELQALCDRYRSKNGSFDVVVPGSGGKDSAFVAHQLKYRYGMHPLCVTWTPFEYTEIGWKNLVNFINSGFDNVLGQPNGILHRKLSRLAFILKGDAWEPFAYGQKAWAFHVACKWGIKLILYGENGELEYGGTEKFKNQPNQDPSEWVTEFYKGSTIEDLVEAGIQLEEFERDEISEKTIQLYKPPHPDEVQKLGAEMHWFSYYHKWTPQENYYYAVKHTGFEPNPEGRSEGTYTKYVSLDDKADGFHWYLQYIKFGMGRASRDAQSDIRRNHITREEGVILTRRYDHEFPKKYYPWFLNYLNISEDMFWYVMNLYRSRSNVWEQANGDWVLKYVVS